VVAGYLDSLGRLSSASFVNSSKLTEDGSYALASGEERTNRLAALNCAHIRPLTEFVRSVRAHRGLSNEIPFFDPRDGGINAGVLFLLEAPGPRAVGSGFISRDNPDPSARNFRALLATAGISRESSALWNIVPWYIGTGTKIRAATASDIEAGAVYLAPLFALFPCLRAVVLVGRKAQRARSRIEHLSSASIFELHHPSNQVVTCWPERRKELENGLNEVAAFLLASEHATKEQSA